MVERRIIRVVDTDGTQLDVELISILENDNNKYLVYTKGEKQKSGNIIIYITKLVVKQGEYYLDNVVNDKEWDSVKSLMSKLINK